MTCHGLASLPKSARRAGPAPAVPWFFFTRGVYLETPESAFFNLPDARYRPYSVRAIFENARARSVKNAHFFFEREYAQAFSVLFACSGLRSRFAHHKADHEQ